MARINQAVVLAGGLGTRLRPITEQIPKPLAPVHGTPFLHFLLAHLAYSGFSEAVLLTGYKGEQIQTYVGRGERWGLKVTCVQEASPLGTGGALKHAESHLAESFAVVNGDTFLPIVYDEAEDRLRDKQVEGVLVVCEKNQEGVQVKPNIAMNDKGRIMRYEKGSEDSQLRYIDGGVGVFLKAVLRDIPDGSCSLEDTVYQAAMFRGALWGWKSPKRFYDMGTLDQLRELEEILK